jgi:predicted helicase
MLNQAKGFAYEKQIRDYILKSKQCYLWSECPENILIQHKLINSHNENRIRRKENKANPFADTGIDIIQINKDNTISFVQCKNGYKNGLCIDNLAGYFFWMLNFPSVNGYVYYTSKLSNNLTMQLLPRTEFIKMPFNEKYLNDEQTNLMNDKLKNYPTINQFIPYDYQTEAEKAINDYLLLQNNDRCILNLPCACILATGDAGGVGKTYTSYLVSKKYDQIIIVSPLKQFAQHKVQA